MMIAQAIQNYLEQQGISIPAFCKRTGLEESYVEQAFRGAVNFSIEEYDRICGALGVSHDFFFPRKEETRAAH